MSGDRIKKGFDLTGKVAIVTGASRGIGESIARGLAEFGAKVVITSRSQESIDAIAENFYKDGFDVHPVACHVGDESNLHQLVENAIQKYGGIDILINNAATNPVYSPIEEMSGELFDKMMNINVKAAFTLSNLCLKSMQIRSGGSIVHISSVEGFKPSAGLSLYSVNKAALIMLAKAQAKEWGRYNVRSNVICPGLVKTKFSSALWKNQKVLDHWNENIPLNRMANPDEMAGLAVFLASGASSYCTGTTFTADGGYLIS
ncbi:MAG: glucose 1-dehydrogenase [Saprospiraceae bacterium]|nr:glucose 1-dehydrogenase [Saprospiraceae bacterium]